MHVPSLCVVLCCVLLGVCVWACVSLCVHVVLLQHLLGFPVGIAKPVVHLGCGNLCSVVLPVGLEWRCHATAVHNRNIVRGPPLDRTLLLKDTDWLKWNPLSDHVRLLWYIPSSIQVPGELGPSPCPLKRQADLEGKKMSKMAVAVFPQRSSLAPDLKCCLTGPTW